MGVLIIATIVILIFVVGCIIYQIRIIAKLREIMQVREDFSYAMVHDMKTPLTTIFTTLSFLHNGRLDDKPEVKERFLTIAEEETDKVLTFANKILTLSKLENHKLEMHKETVPLQPILDKLAERFKLKAAKPVTFTFDLQTPTVCADAEYLEEVFRNLIDNAVKYSKESVDIRITSDCNDNDSIIKVYDNGLGISFADQRVIFNKYERGKAGRSKCKNKVSGFGLGLNFVQQVVEAHGGKIIVNSIEGEFTEFTIFLPLIMKEL